MGSSLQSSPLAIALRFGPQARTDQRASILGSNVHLTFICEPSAPLTSGTHLIAVLLEGYNDMSIQQQQMSRGASGWKIQGVWSCFSGPAEPIDHHDSRPAAEESQAPPHSPVSDADKPPAILSSSCTFHHGPIPPPGLIDPDGPKGTYALRMHSVPSNVWGASGKLSAVSEGIGTQQVPSESLPGVSTARSDAPLLMLATLSGQHSSPIRNSNRSSLSRISAGGLKKRMKSAPGIASGRNDTADNASLDQRDSRGADSVFQRLFTTLQASQRVSGSGRSVVTLGASAGSGWSPSKGHKGQIHPLGGDDISPQASARSHDWQVGAGLERVRSGTSPLSREQLTSGPSTGVAKREPSELSRSGRMAGAQNRSFVSHLTPLRDMVLAEKRALSSSASVVPIMPTRASVQQGGLVVDTEP